MSGAHQDLPEDLSALFEAGPSGDELILDRNGSWRRGGVTLRDEKTIEFLNRSLTSGGAGTWIIRYGAHTRPAIVEDAPVFVTGVNFSGIFRDEKITLELSTGKTELLDINTLSYKNNALYCLIENGSVRAKFMTSPSYRILGRIDEVDGRFYLNLCGQKILIERD